MLILHGICALLLSGHASLRMKPMATLLSLLCSLVTAAAAAQDSSLLSVHNGYSVCHKMIVHRQVELSTLI